MTWNTPPTMNGQMKGRPVGAKAVAVQQEDAARHGDKGELDGEAREQPEDTAQLGPVPELAELSIVSRRFFVRHGSLQVELPGKYGPELP